MGQVTTPEDTKIKALPGNLVESQNWLHELLDSRLFHLVWEEQKHHGPPGMSRLLPACRSFLELFTSFDQKTILFHRLNEVSAHFDRHECELLAMTAPGFKEDVGKAESGVKALSPHDWSLVEEQEAWVEEHIELVGRWRHLKNVVCVAPAPDSPPLGGVGGCDPPFPHP